MTQIVTADFETFYSREYSLQRLTTTEYILHPLFQVIGLSLKLGDTPARWYTDDDIPGALSKIDWADSALLAHHTRFDGAILAWHYGIRPSLYLDSLGMAKALVFADTGSSSLAAVASALGVGTKGAAVHNFVGYRRENFSPVQLAAYGQYCCTDNELSYGIFRRLKPHIPASELRLIDQLIRAFINPILRLDGGQLTNYREQLRAHMANLLSTLGVTVGQLRSDEQFAELLQEAGVTPPKKYSPRTSQMAWAFAKTDAEFLALKDHEDPRVQALVAARLGTKTTIEISRTERLQAAAYLLWPGGTYNWLPVPLAYFAAHTGRLGGTDSINLQNLRRHSPVRPSPLRFCILAPNGSVIVTADASQIEARLLAWLAGQWDLVQAFAVGRDVYAEFAGVLYGLVVTKTSHPAERFIGKTGILGCGYGCGPDKFHAMLRLGGSSATLMDAYTVVSAYRQTYPAIPALWQMFNDLLVRMVNMAPQDPGFLFCPFPWWQQLNLWVTRETLQLPNGMHLIYRDLQRDIGGELTYKYGNQRKKIYGAKLVENYIQALARIVVLDKISVIEDTYPGRAQFALTIHDSLAYVVPEEEGCDFHGFLIAEMSKPPNWCSGAPLAAEGGWGPTLGDAEVVKAVAVAPFLPSPAPSSPSPSAGTDLPAGPVASGPAGLPSRPPERSSPGPDPA